MNFAFSGTQTNEAFVLVIDVPVPTQGFFKYKQYGIVVKSYYIKKTDVQKGKVIPMFEYEQETYGSKGRERIRAAAMAHTGKKGKVLLPPTRRQKAEGLDKVEVDVCFESASSNFLVCSTLPTRRNKQHRITVTYAQIASGEVKVKW